jgi:hypothetical protein
MNTKHGAIHLALQYISGKEKWWAICCGGNTEVTLRFKGVRILTDSNNKNDLREKCIDINTHSVMEKGK